MRRSACRVASPRRERHVPSAFGRPGGERFIWRDRWQPTIAFLGILSGRCQRRLMISSGTRASAASLRSLSVLEHLESPAAHRRPPGQKSPEGSDAPPLNRDASLGSAGRITPKTSPRDGLFMPESETRLPRRGAGNEPGLRGAHEQSYCDRTEAENGIDALKNQRGCRDFNTATCTAAGSWR